MYCRFFFWLALFGLILSFWSIAVAGPQVVNVLGIAINLALAVYWAHQSSKD